MLESATQMLLLAWLSLFLIGIAVFNRRWSGESWVFNEPGALNLCFKWTMIGINASLFPLTLLIHLVMEWLQRDR